jgi:hypothetical protein
MCVRARIRIIFHHVSLPLALGVPRPAIVGTTRVLD